MRVRLTQIAYSDLSLFTFDYDVTMMIFFLSPEEKVYARYGGRDAKDADSRQSLLGLRATMQSVLKMHRSEQKVFAPRDSAAPVYASQLPQGRARGCIHCHDAKELLYDELASKNQWNRDLLFRYPPPDNLGFVLDVDRSSAVKTVQPDSPAAKAGLQAGDLVQLLNEVPIHSFADASYALDRAPKTGEIGLTWQRGDRTMTGTLTLPPGWRKTDISWRPSLVGWVPSPHLSGPDLTAAERKELGLSERQLAFRQQAPVHSRAKASGIQVGDIILDIDGKHLETNAAGFYYHVRQNYVVGERVTIHILRKGQRLRQTMILSP